MDYNLLERTILDAISRGDVELLIALYKDSNGVDDGDELQELIDNNVPVIASRNGIRAGPMPFKNFVINIYDVAQAQKAYDSNTVNEYLDNGGIAQAKSLAKVLVNTLDSIPDRYWMINIDPILTKVSEALSEVLLKLNHQYNDDIDTLSKSRFRRDLIINFFKLSNYDSLELYLEYPSALTSFIASDTFFYRDEKKKFFKYYLNKYFPSRRLDVLEDIRKYLKGDAKWDLISLADILLEMPNVTIKEKHKLIDIETELLK